MGNKSLTAVDRSVSILDRSSSIQNQPLTEAQASADQLVSVSLQEGTNLKTAAAMLGAGWVGRFTRIGVMTALPGHAFVRGASYVPALAAESAAFAGIERGFHPSTQPFHKDWAKDAFTLAALKGFGGITRSQNLAVQHLFTDLGLVSGQHAVYLAGLTEKPQGSFTQQMIHAEATNWHMKGSLAFAHTLSPKLSASEKSLEIFLKSQEGGLFNKGEVSPFFSQLAMATSGGGEGKGRFGEEAIGPIPGADPKPAHGPRRLGEILKEVLPRLKPIQDPTTTLVDSLATMAIRGKKGEGSGGKKRRDKLTPEENQKLWRLLEEAKSSNVETREKAILDLVNLAKTGIKDTASADALYRNLIGLVRRIGVKDAALAEVLHKRAMEEVDKTATVMPDQHPTKQDLYKRAMVIEWSAASACPVGLEPSRRVLYRSAGMLALKAGDLDALNLIIREALRGDSKGSENSSELAEIENEEAKKYLRERLVLGTQDQKSGEQVPGTESSVEWPRSVQAFIDEGYRPTRTFPLEGWGDSKGREAFQDYEKTLEKNGTDYIVVDVGLKSGFGISRSPEYVVLERSKEVKTIEIDLEGGGGSGGKRVSEEWPKSVQAIIDEGYRVTRSFAPEGWGDSKRLKALKDYEKTLKKNGIDYRVVDVGRPSGFGISISPIYYVLEKPLPEAVQDLVNQGYQVTKLFTSSFREEFKRYEGQLNKKEIDYRIVTIHESGQGLHNVYFKYYVLERRGMGARSLAGAKGFIAEEMLDHRGSMAGLPIPGRKPLSGQFGSQSPGMPSFPSSPWNKLSFREKLTYFVDHVSADLYRMGPPPDLQGTLAGNLIHKTAIKALASNKKLTSKAFLGEINQNLPKRKQLSMKVLMKYLEDTVIGREIPDFS